MRGRKEYAGDSAGRWPNQYLLVPGIPPGEPWRPTMEKGLIGGTSRLPNRRSYIPQIRPTTAIQFSSGRVQMTSKNAEWIAAERADGARCYQQKTPWLDWKSQHWKEGYSSAQQDALKIKRQASRPLGAPAPLIDVKKLERMRMGGR